MASDTCPQDGSATICRLCRPRRLCRPCRPTPPRTPEHPRTKPQHPSSPAVQNRAPHATSRPPPGFSPSRGRGPIAIGLQALRRRAAVPGSGGDRLDIDSIDRLDRCSPGPETPQPTSSTEARTAPTEFSVSPGLPSLDVDMLADEGAWWSLSDRYIFRGSSPTWWYGDLSTGTYRVLQAEGSSPSFSEIASAADLPSGGEPVGPTRQLAYDAATAAPDGVFAYSATTTVRSGSAQAVSWELTVLKIDLQAGRVVTSRSMTMPAEVESTSRQCAARGLRRLQPRITGRRHGVGTVPRPGSVRRGPEHAARGSAARRLRPGRPQRRLPPGRHVLQAGGRPARGSAVRRESP